MKCPTFLTLAGTALASTIRIDVGQSGFTFSPSTVNATLGDLLEFHFHAINHSVVQGDFSSPCQPTKTGGFFSGFVPTTSGENSNVFQVKVNSTDPIFYYCSQNVGSHCKNGMVGAVNPTSDQTLATYQNNARSVDSAVSPAAPFGGLTVAGSDSTASQTTSAPASTSTCPAPKSGGGGYRRRDTACGNAASGGAVVSVAAALVAVGMAVLMV